MFKNYEACVIFDRDNRYYFSRNYVSSGCIVLSESARFYVTDSRYETQLKENLKGFEIVIAKRGETEKAVADVLRNLSATIVGYEDESMTCAQHRALSEALGIAQIHLAPCSKDIDEMRSIKTAEEQEIMAAGQKLAIRAYEAGHAKLKGGVTEREVAGAILYEMLHGGADDYSFLPVVAFGANSAKPHHAPSDTRLEKGDAVIIDIGCRYKGYCTDLTRTTFYGKAEHPELEKVYQTVLEAQKAALNGIKAGVTCHEADSFAREHIRAAGYGEYFGHGTGHGIGVKIHELPSLIPGNETIIKENMVITVEPGIYLPGKGGVRIEDMAVVTTNGVANMTPLKK